MHLWRGEAETRGELRLAALPRVRTIGRLQRVACGKAAARQWRGSGAAAAGGGQRAHRGRRLDQQRGSKRALVQGSSHRKPTVTPQNQTACAHTTAATPVAVDFRLPGNNRRGRRAERAHVSEVEECPAVGHATVDGVEGRYAAAVELEQPLIWACKSRRHQGLFVHAGRRQGLASA